MKRQQSRDLRFGNESALGGRRGDAGFSVEKFAAFCADSDGRPLSEEEMASARQLCRELQQRATDSEAW